MFSKIGNFIKSKKTAIIWTAFYFGVLYFLFRFMFKFNMLKPNHWETLPNVHLHGLPGLAFGVLILATLPIYFATMMYIFKNNKTPIPLPFCKEKTHASKEEKDQSIETPEPEVKIPAGLPREMMEPYMRLARREAKKRSDYELADIDEIIEQEKPAPPPEPIAPYIVPAKEITKGDAIDAIPNLSQSIKDDTAAGGIPIPTDFDFDDVKEPTNAPVFKEISFGGGAGPDSYNSKTELQNELEKSGFQTEKSGDLIIAKKEGSTHVIAPHDDSDFWIADGDEWFASGKQKSSLVKALMEFTDDKDANPILYLKESNIMNLDALTVEWTDKGVRVIKSLSDL
jgi:hypothetical protein